MSYLKRLLLLWPILYGSLFLAAQGPPNQTDASVRIGIAGLTHDHVHWLLGRKQTGDLEIVGIVEPNEEVAERYMQQYDLDKKLFFPSLKKMIRKANPDGVCVFAPTSQHLEILEACARRKVHVMVEKPLATNLADAQQMVQLARESGIHLLTHYETTHFSSFQRGYHIAKRQRQVGDIRRIVMMAGHAGPKAIGVSEEFMAWLGDSIQNGGGAIMDFGCYGINILNWFTQGQRPNSVTAVTQHLQPEVYPEVDDEATIILTYPELTAIIQASWNWPDNRKVLEIYGTNGYVHCLDPESLRIVKSDHPDDRRVPAPKGRPPMNEGYGFFATVIKGKINPGQWFPSSVDNNLLVVEILELARQSASTGKTIHLKE